MLILEENGVLLSVDLFPDLNHKLTIEPFYYQINSEAIKCGLIKSLSSYYKHCKINPKLETGWTKFLTDDNLVVLHCLNENLPEILGVMVHQTPKNKCELHALCIKELLKLVERTFRSKDEDTQLATIKLICSLANVAQEEKTLLDCIRMSNYFLVSNFSLVSREASLMICEMCDRNNVTPIKMFNWYQRIILKLVITLCVTNYFSFNSTMMDTLNIVSILLLINFKTFCKIYIF